MMLKYDTSEHIAFSDVSIAGSASTCGLAPEMCSAFCYETPTMEVHRKKTCDATNIVETQSSVVAETQGKSKEDSIVSNILSVDLSTESINDISETISPVTHIEIIKSGSRRVTGANRVVPFLTSALKAGKQTVAETSLGQVYKTFLSDLNSSDNNKKCMICLDIFLSCTELEYHVRSVHVMDVSANQCFVCRKKYIFQDQLQNHLNHIHSIHSPDLICKICFMEFGTTIEQKAHERKHDKSHVCSMCSEEFSTEYLYQKHLNQHIFQVKPNDCKKCGKRFKNITSLQVHEKRHVSIICLICRMHFVSDVSFLLHTKEHKSEDVMKLLKHVERKDQEETHFEEVLALYMNLTLKSKTNTQEDHESNAQENSVFECLTTMVSAVSQISDSGVTSRKGMECKLCGVNVSSDKELLDHRKKFHLRNRTCPFCGKRNRSVSQTWRHMNSHLLKNKEKLPKVNCNNKKQVKSNLNYIEDRSEGTSLVKNKQAPKHPHLYSCNICSRKFLYPGSRDSHVLQHSKDKCDSWKCTMCEKIFSHPSLLLTHISVHEQTITCYICDKPFLSENALQLHIKTHFFEEEKKMFNCNICSVKCPSLAGLQAHLRCHAGERPYVCGQCNGRFKRREALKKHIQVVHNSASLQYHSCLECQRMFNSSGNLIRHYVRIHCQVRRFICGLCGSRFSQNQDFRRHFKVFHKVEMPNINGSDRKALTEVYVIPGIDGLTEADPHAVKIRAIVAEEKAKFSRLSDLLATNGVNENTYDKSVIGDLSKEKFQQSVAVLQSSAEKVFMVEADGAEKETSSAYLEKVLHVEQNSPRKLYFAHSNVNDCDKLYSCEHCKRAFSGENEYMEHVAEESKSYTCRQCGNNFCNQVLLDNHFVSVHGFMQQSISLCDLNHKENCCKDEQNYCGLQNLSNVPQEEEQETINIEQDSAVMKHISQEEIAILSNSIKDASAFSSIDGVGNAISTLPLCNNVGDVDSTNIPTTFNFNGFIVQNVIIQQNPSMLPPAPVDLQNQGILNAITPVISLNSNISVNHHSSPLYNINDIQNIAIVKDDSSSNILPISEGVNQQNLEENPTNGMNMRETSDKCREISNNSGNLEREDLDKSDSFDRDSRKMHSPDDHNKVTCNHCGDKFYNKSTLKRHMKCHAETKSGNNKPFGCSDCGKHFAEKHNLRVHLMTHTGERPYKCEDCGKQLRYRKDIMDHKRMHLGEKPFACNVCDRKFIRQRELIRHQLIHTGEKKHECPICGKTFARLDLLRRGHLPTHATGSSHLKHTCNVCNKSFRLKSTLKQHEFLHSGLKKFKCELCKKSFALEMYLKTHMQCHKKRDNYLQCSKCPRRFVSEATLKVHEDSFHARLKRKKKHEKIVEGSCASEEDSTIHIGNLQNEEEFGTDSGITDINLDALETNNCNTVIYLQMTPDDLKYSLN